MYAVTLTSIPPRFAGLDPVLRSLLSQDPAPVRVILSLPRAYRRFPGPVTLPDLPKGVEILWSTDDLGPATKVIPAARHLRGKVERLIYCDDDWIYGQGWARALLRQAAGADVIAGSGFSVLRLRRQGAQPPATDIAQGFAGVCIRPSDIPDVATPVPDPAWAVDDIWLSGLFAHQGLKIHVAPEARALCHPAATVDPGLQEATVLGHTRAQANAACADLVFQKFGIWPPRAEN